MKKTLIALALGAILPVAASAAEAPAAAPHAATASELQHMIKRFAPVQLKADTSKLSAGDKKAIAKLIEAAKVVDTLRKVLPDALVLVSYDFDEARRHADRIVRERPEAVLSGGGDGAVTRLLNFLREAGMTQFPAVGVLGSALSAAGSSCTDSGSSRRIISPASAR